MGKEGPWGQVRCGWEEWFLSGKGDGGSVHNSTFSSLLMTRYDSYFLSFFFILCDGMLISTCRPRCHIGGQPLAAQDRY